MNVEIDALINEFKGMQPQVGGVAMGQNSDFGGMNPSLNTHNQGPQKGELKWVGLQREMFKDGVVFELKLSGGMLFYVQRMRVVGLNGIFYYRWFSGCETIPGSVERTWGRILQTKVRKRMIGATKVGYLGVVKSLSKVTEILSKHWQHLHLSFDLKWGFVPRDGFPVLYAPLHFFNVYVDDKEKCFLQLNLLPHDCEKVAELMDHKWKTTHAKKTVPLAVGNHVLFFRVSTDGGLVLMQETRRKQRSGCYVSACVNYIEALTKSLDLIEKRVAEKGAASDFKTFSTAKDAIEFVQKKWPQLFPVGPYIQQHIEVALRCSKDLLWYRDLEVMVGGPRPYETLNLELVANMKIAGRVQVLCKKLDVFTYAAE